VLTEKGEAIHALMETNVTAVEQTLIAGFSDEEKETLFHLLQKLRTNLENDNGSK
jgi:DNA-binding MarR family transcriptional regulator